MKQVWPNYSYSPTTNVLTLTGLNIDRDQLLLVTAADRGRIMYNFADSSVTASAFTSGANTALTLVATTAGLTTTAALVIYFDDQATSSTVTGTVELGPTSLNALESITVTMGQVTVTGGLTDVQLRASAVTVGGTITVGNSVTVSSLPSLAAGTAQIGSVTASITGTVPVSGTFYQATQPVSLASVPALSAGANQIGSVTASITGTVPVSGTFWQATQPVSLASVPAHAVTLTSTTVTVSSLPALTAGTNQIGSVTASISGTVPVSISSVTIGNSVNIGSLPAISGTVTANNFAAQGTAVTTSNFTSTTVTVLANFNATRKVLTIFNEGAGNLYVSAGSTCSTVQYQVRLSSGDYYEAPSHQTTITHSAVFATSGTARVTEIT
jgi:hypothetical protein